MRSRDKGYEFGVGAVGIDVVDRFDKTSRIQRRVSSVRSTIHMPDVVWSLCPRRTTLSNKFTVSLSLLSNAVHPASHSTPGDKRDHEVNSLNTWDLRASKGIVLRIKSPLREDVM